MPAPGGAAQAVITAIALSDALPAAGITSTMPAGGTDAREDVTGAITAITPSIVNIAGLMPVLIQVIHGR